MTPEALARNHIDQFLQAASWQVRGLKQANIHAITGVAIREFPINAGHGEADYLLYVNGKACGVIEAIKEGATLKGVEVQSARYSHGLPVSPLPADEESPSAYTPRRCGSPRCPQHLLSIRNPSEY
jgi:type I restriction enzyme R subunit